MERRTFRFHSSHVCYSKRPNKSKRTATLTAVRGRQTYIRQVKQPIGVEDNGEDGEDDLQDGKLEGSQFEQEERAPGFRTEAVTDVRKKQPAAS